MPASRSNAIIAGVAFVALFVGAISLVMLIHLDTTVPLHGAEIAWWKKTLVYHIYVPSFYDGKHDDGYGDLKGRHQFL